MTRKELVEYLNGIEDRYPIHKWKIGGIYIWPLIKIKLFFKWTLKDDGEVDKSRKEQNKKGVMFFVEVFLSFVSLFRLFFKRNSNKRSILFVESASHRADFEGKLVNKYFTPLENCQSDDAERYDFVYFTDFNGEVNSYPNQNTVFFRKYFYATYVIQFVKSLFKLQRLSGIDGLEKELEEKGLIENSSQFLEDIKKQYIQIAAAKQVSLLVIKKYKIRLIFELCYYSNLRFGVNLSSREHDIPVYEVQHGGMGPEHISYSGWRNVPQSGYELLPQYFWLWDEPSYILLNSWIKNQSYHKAILGGNPWLGYVIENLYGKYDFPTEKKIILYTLQRRDIEEYILKAISITPDDYEWWIRLHPRKLDNMPKIERALAKYAVAEKVVLESATHYPLPLVLKKANIHLSGFSGSIIEAAQLNTFSLILSDIGVNAFQLYIESGFAAAELSESPEQLVDSIKKNSSKVNLSSNNDLYNYKALMNRIVCDALV